LKHWRDADRFKMFNIVPTMRVDGQFNLSPVDIYIKIKELPSIRGFWDTMPVAAWLAKHYPKTSSALFAGADDAKALAIWKDEKYTVAATVRRSNADAAEGRAIRKNLKTMQAFAELRKNMGDRWGKTDWQKCK
jgi:hypothetical protein